MSLTEPETPLPLTDPETPLFSFAEAEERPALLPEDLTNALQEHFGLAGFRGGQQQVIERVLAGRSTLALMPTGAGKSLCYQLPALLLPCATVVISPLIALMKDQLDGLPPAVRERATIINSSIPYDEVRTRLREIAAGRFKLVYVAPERLRQRHFLHALAQAGISLFVVDEAHCVSLWGFSFRPDYLFIREAIDELGRPPVLALTATASPATEREIIAQLGDLEVVRTNVFRPNLHFEVIKAPNNDVKESLVVELCTRISGPVIVYVRSRHGCEKVAALLQQAGIEAEAYHAQRPDREAIQDRFMRGQIRVIAATIAFGMGVDKPDVRGVIHLTLPKSLEDYAQEAGRAGRDGQISRCVLLYSATDKGQLTTWLNDGQYTVEELRDVYKGLLRLIGSGQRLMPLGELLPYTNYQQIDARERETRLRVALGVLERVGVVRRHFDLPRVIKLRRGDGADPAAAALCDALRLNGRWTEWDSTDLAGHLELPLSQLEPTLLRQTEGGGLYYEGAAREMLLELLPAPKDTREQMQLLLSKWMRSQQERLDALGEYARTKHCRHRMLAAQFGQRLAPCGDACDVCRTGRRAHTAPPAISGAVRPVPKPGQSWGSNAQADHHRVMIEAVRQHPGELSSRDLAHMLTGSRGYGNHPLFGALADRSFESLRAEIDVLVEAGQLAYRGATLVVAAASVPAERGENPALTILQALTRLPFGLGRSGLARLLKGSSSSVQPSRSPDHGALQHLKMDLIEQTIEGLVSAGLVERDPDDKYRVLRINDAGRAALDNPASLPPMVQTTRARAFSVAEPAGEPDGELLERLKVWRADQASKLNVPRFFIFSDAVLFDIATQQPMNEDELGTIKGIGAQKLTQWGADILGLVAERGT
jgi:ATP-dependent DNA helicase RecQ